VIDILMISLVPLGVFMIALLGLATFWRWDSPKDKGLVLAVSTGALLAVAGGWLLYRFGWNDTSWLLVAGSLLVVGVSYVVGRWGLQGFAAFAASSASSTTPLTRADRRREVVALVVGGVLLLVYVVWTVWRALG
jgi:hypothetical protein